MKMIIQVFLFIYLSQVCAWGQEQLGKVSILFKADEIQVEGNKKIETEAILERMSIKAGAPVDNYSLQKDIKKIYDLKYFKTVEAHREQKNGKNILVMKVKEKPSIAQIKFEGNDELSRDDLKGKIASKEYNILDISTIKKDLTKILELYEEKGFYMAQVEYSIEPTKNESVDLVFRIREFTKVRVKKIQFLGNSEIKDEELLKFMQTKEESFFSGLSGSGSYKEFNFQTDIERLKYLYKTKGYLQINIGNPVVTVSEDKRWIFITLRVQEGPQFTVNNIYYNGELLFTDTEMNKKTDLKPNQTYSEEKLRLDIQTLTEMYQDEGYAFANVLRTLKIVPGENKVDIHYSFEKGKIAYFGKINVIGNTKTRDKVVRRELRIHEGMRYSGSLLRKSKENVNRLGFFEQNSVIFNTVAAKGKDDVLDVEVNIKERQTGQISVGAGYSSATKGFFQGSIAQNNFNGLGQNLNLQLNLAENQQTYELGFTEPYLFDTRWTGGVDFYKTDNSLTTSFTSKKWGTDLRVGYPIFEYTRLFLSFRHEYTYLENVRNPTINIDIENGTAASLVASLNYDRRNNIFEPTDGYFGSISLDHTGVYGEQRWFKATAEARHYKPIWEDLVLRQRFRFSQLYKTAERGIPRSEKFQMGGARNMRGYGYEDVGPTAVLIDTSTNRPAKFNLGGLASVLYTLEFENPISKEAGLKWVVFYDAGNVYKNYYGEDGNNALRQDYGVGIRWFSPIGVLRFEFGYPIDPEPGNAGQQFHFDIGQLF